MVATILNFFQAASAKPAISVTTEAAPSTTVEAGKKFARMINESADPREPAAKPRSNQADSSSVTTKSATAKPAGKAKQELPAEEKAPLLAHEITPEEASLMLALLPAQPIQAQQMPEAAPAANRTLQTELEAIIATGTPKSVADINAALQTSTFVTDQSPAASFNAELAATGTIELPTSLTTTNNNSDPAIEASLLALVKDTLDHTTGVSSDEAQTAASTPTATATNPALAENPAPAAPPTTIAANAAERSDAATIRTEVREMAQEAIIAKQTTTSATVPAAEPIAVQENLPLDARIPSLEIEKKKESLPEITLPGAKPTAPETTSQTITPNAVAAAASAPTISGDAKGEDTALAEAISATTDAKPTARHDGIVAPHGPAHAQQVAPAATTTVNAVPLISAPVKEQVTVAIRQAKSEGIEQITIQLDPLDLGRVEVKMHVAADGKASLSFLVDKPETFDALSRDARALERSLQESGIKADTGGMQFNLRQQPQPQSDLGGQNGQRHSNNAPLGRGEAETTSASVTQLAPARTYRLDFSEGVDIRA